MRTSLQAIGMSVLFVPMSGSGLHSAAGASTATTPAVVNANGFEERYRRWKEHVRKRTLEAMAQGDKSLARSDRFPFKRVFENEPFRDLVNLGVAALPEMIAKVKEDPQLGTAVYRVSKWRYHVKRTGDAPTRFVWFVEEFPEISSEKGPPGPPGPAQVYPYWWETGRKMVPQLFQKLYRQWKRKKAAGDTERAKDRYQRIVDLGLMALPCIVDKVLAGDADLMPALVTLSDGAISKDAKPEAIRAWWTTRKKELKVLLDTNGGDVGENK